MKKIYIYVFLILVILIGLIFVIKVCKEDKILEIKETFASLTVASNSYLKEVNEENEKSKILIYYPETTYKILNEEILNLVKSVAEDFKYRVDSFEDSKLDRKFELNINFDTYEYDNYVSYVFYTTIDDLGAHPEYHIATVNYDIKNDKIITIDDLSAKNPNLLNVLSKYCYETLSNEDVIKEYGSLDQLKEGTEAKLSNFKNIVFTKSGLIIFFEKYSVGPYVLGDFSVTVPYDKII